jgi:hypothetical protein
MKYSGNLQMFLLAAIAFWLLAGTLMSAAVPLVVRRTPRWAPASRHRALVLLGLAVPVLTLTALISVALPSLLGSVWPELDHCIVHEGHPHLCFVHASPHADTLLGWVLIGGAALSLAPSLATRASALWNAPRLLDRLVRLARWDARRQIWVVPTEQPFCMSVGLLRPRIVVSAGLLAAATDDELTIMLSHEAAHVRQRHTLTRLLVRVASFPLLPQSRRALLTTLELSAEQACDEAAAARIGDRLRVAEIIVAMERRLVTVVNTYSPVAAFGASSVSQRVESMLSPQRHTGAALTLALLLSALVVGVLCISPPLHHVTESTLALLAH